MCNIFDLVRTLPNWTDLKSSREKGATGAEKNLMKAHNMYNNSEEESPKQVQERNKREAEMLTSNLGEGFITHQEILSEIGVLKELAILQESMVHNLKIVFCFSFLYHIHSVGFICFSHIVGMVFASN